MDKKKDLFQEFPKVSREEWEAKIETDLKGAPYKRLITKTIEGIDLKPYYHKEDLKNLGYLNSLPGEFPYTRSGKTQLNEWEIRQDIKISDIHKANKTALLALNRGADALSFEFPEDIETGSTTIKDLLNEIFFECIRIDFKSCGKSESILDQLLQLSKEKETDPTKLSGGLNDDPLSRYALTGNTGKDMGKAFDGIAERINKFSSELPGIKHISVNADIFHNAGASAVQELALALSMTVENLHQLTERGLSPDVIAQNLILNFSTGPSYFMEIAKFRAARLLFANLIDSYKVTEEKSKKVFIHATVSEWNQTVYDPYVNMLRATTENMSAVLGNVDSFSQTPFDTPFRENTEFSERIARNTQIILKEEAHLDKIIDPSAGSYYIESLTDAVAENAWKLFLEIEEKGGFISALENGSIQEIIEETARSRDLNLATRREILLGTNQYPNPSENLDEETLKLHDNKKKNPDTGFKTIRKYRGAIAFEELRMKTAKSGKDPLVFLLTYGNVTWRKARAGFASGFFACAGYRIQDNTGFDSIKEGMDAANEAGANIIVLCSSDDDYPVIAPEVLSDLNENQILVVAGYPKDSIDDLKKMGVNHFIHVKSNLLEELQMFNAQLGIN